MSGLTPRLKVTMLRALRDAQGPVSSGAIARQAQAAGFDVSPRTVRLYLEDLERDGLVAQARRGRHGGRSITARGLLEIDQALVAERVGMTAARVDNLAWRMHLDLDTGEGQVVLNLTTVAEEDLARAVACMVPVMRERLGMGIRLALFRAGEFAGERPIPDGRVGIGTVCSVTVNGILLTRRIHATSLFGGVLELDRGQPVRFTDVIYYDGTSLDPLEIFIKGGLTSCGEAARTGRGRIGASFREVPGEALDEVQSLLADLQAIGLGGALLVGKPNQPLLGFPCQHGRTGLVIAGGLNPIAAIQEGGIPTESFALNQLFDFEKLVDYRDLALQLGVRLR